MMKAWAAAAAAAAMALPAVLADTCPVEMALDLSRYVGAARPWTKNDAKQDFTDFHFGKGWERTLVGNGELLVQNPKGCIGSSECGLTFAARLPTGLESGTLSYDFKFEPGYDWTRGGKLPGICSLDCPSGCSPMSKADGFSSRLMFRSEGALMSYMYYPGKSADHNCGEDWFYDVNAQAGTWHTINLYVKMNTPGVANGVQKAWLDGKLVLDYDSIMFRYDAKHKIQTFTFNNFHGGKADNFRPDHDQWVAFRNIKLAEGECPPGSTASGSTASGSAVADNVNVAFDLGTVAPQEDPEMAELMDISKREMSVRVREAEAALDGGDPEVFAMRPQQIGKGEQGVDPKIPAYLMVAKQATVEAISDIKLRGRLTDADIDAIVAAAEARGDPEYKLRKQLLDAEKAVLTQSRGGGAQAAQGGAPRPAKTATAAKANTDLSVAFAARKQFPSGVCGVLDLTNSGSELCNTWTLEMCPDETNLDVSKMRVWNLEDIEDETDSMMFKSFPDQQYILGGQKLINRIPGVCVFWLPRNTPASEAEVTAMLGVTATCLA